MQVKHQDLARHLRDGLKPIYLVTSDETLLVEESCDAIIQAAQAQGFSERSVHHVETGFSWHDLTHDAASISLFAERKLLDVRIGAKKFDRNASSALREWVEENAQSQDNVLLLRTGRLDKRQKSSAWFKAIDQVGVVITIWPVDARQLPAWLGERAKAAGLEVERDALVYLAERVEGNLLAAQQEVQKLALMDMPSPITVEALVEYGQDVARFDSFDLLDAMMAGQTEKTARILHSLKAEGVAILAIVGALTSQLRRMDQPQGLPPQRRKLLEALSRRIRDVHPVLAECAVIDQQVKGQLRGDPWVSLEQVVLRLAGARALSVPSKDQLSLGAR